VIKITGLRTIDPTDPYRPFAPTEQGRIRGLAPPMLCTLRSKGKFRDTVSTDPLPLTGQGRFRDLTSPNHCS